MTKVNIALLAAVVAAAIFLSTLGSGFATGLQSGLLSLLSPFLKTGSAVEHEIGKVGTGIRTLQELEADNQELVLKNQQLAASNLILRDIEAENNKLRQALDYRERSAFRLIPARIIGRDSTTWWNTVKINRGFADGVEADMPVLTDTGLVGKTTTVSKDMSIVLLATDETCKVAAKVEGSPEQGILQGARVQDAATAECRLNFLSKSANLQPDQKVYTAGVSGGVFPSGILIGSVKSFHTRELDGQAIVQPAVDLSAVEDVFIVIGAK